MSDKEKRKKQLEDRKKERDEEFKACQYEINNQFDEKARTNITNYMDEKISKATELANKQISDATKLASKLIRDASEQAYNEAIEKFGDKDKQVQIEKVCFFKKWDEEAQTFYESS